MIQNILPSSVASFELAGAFAEHELLPGEERVVEHAVPKRWREFASGRHCARKALAKLGLPPLPILSGPDRQPIWPPNIVGSITHCAEYCAAAVASRGLVRAIGIDAEVNEPLPAGVAEHVLYGDERDLLQNLPSGSICWDRLLFSAKEALYKVWFPIERRWLGFEDARISIRPEDSTFGIGIWCQAVDGVFRSPMMGRFLVTGGLVLTSVVLLEGGDASVLGEVATVSMIPPFTSFTQ